MPPKETTIQLAPNDAKISEITVYPSNSVSYLPSCIALKYDQEPDGLLFGGLQITVILKKFRKAEIITENDYNNLCNNYPGLSEKHYKSITITIANQVFYPLDFDKFNERLVGQLDENNTIYVRQREYVFIDKLSNPKSVPCNN